MMLPPPRAMLITSGIRKLVRTPAISTDTDASLGNPLTSAPPSVDVPPTSMTMQLRMPERKAAPLMLLVGPEAMVKTG